jgi:hypothetical protein
MLIVRIVTFRVEMSIETVDELCRWPLSPVQLRDLGLIKNNKAILDEFPELWCETSLSLRRWQTQASTAHVSIILAKEK